MPSADAPIGLGVRPGATPPGRWDWLRSQGLGVLCGSATVLLLGTGSVVMAITRDGASAGIGLDDLTAFFTRPNAAHLWLYLLVPVAALYALNTLLATWETVTTRWRSGLRQPRAYAAAVMHLAFLVALVAHLAGGFLSAEPGGAVLTEGWQPLPAFGEARLVSLEVDTLPNGMPREARALVEVRDASGKVTREEAGYNQPLSRGFGARLALLQEQGRVPLARLASGDVSCVLTQGQGCAVGVERVEVMGFGEPRVSGPGAVLVRVSGAGAAQARWLQPGDLLALQGGRPLQLLEAREGPAIALRVRQAPGNPIALLASVLLALGVLMMWRRLAP